MTARPSPERLQEALADAQRQLEEERADRQLLELLLQAVGTTSTSPSSELSFERMLEELADSLGFGGATLVEQDESGAYRATVSTSGHLELSWERGALVERLEGGEVVVVTDTVEDAAWAAMEDTLRAGIGSAIHVPLLVAPDRAFLVCTHPERAHFTRKHATLLRRAAPIVAQAFRSIRAYAVEQRISDLERQHEAAAALAQTSSRMAALLTSLQSAILVEDEERKVVLANETFCDMFGIGATPQELVGADCAAMAEQAKAAFKDPDAFMARVDELLEAGSVVEGDELRTVDGRILLRDFVPIVVDGEGMGYLWQYRDVTARRAGEALNRAIIGTALDAIVTIDHHGNIVEFNPSAEEIFGHERASVLGRRMGDVIVPEPLREAHAAGMRRYLDSGEPHILGNRLELSAVRADGTEFPIELTVNRIPDSQPPIFTGFIRDITEQKRRAEELSEARDVAEQASRAKSDFLAMMSHEIRTPMNAILGMTELALDLSEPGEQRDLLRSVESNAESLLNVINDVLDFSRVEAGHLTLRHEAFSVADVVESVAEVLSTRAFEKGLELTCTVDPALNGPVEGDPHRLRQVLINLVGNAVKYTESGHVSVAVEQIEHEDGVRRAEFTVLDTGVGIEADALRRVFEPFYQAGSRDRRRGGTGLGLGISKSIVELMEGEISVESELGSGSVFRFTLPFAEADHVFARRRAADSVFERWQAWVVTPEPHVAASVTGTLAHVGIPCEMVDTDELAERLESTSSGVKNMVVADQRLGLDLLDSVAETAAAAEEHAEVRLCVLIPPGPVGAWRVSGPRQTRYVTKPANRRKLVGVVTGSADVEGVTSPQSSEEIEFAGGRVLLVEDNEANQKYALRVLDRGGFQADLAEDGVQGLRMAAEHTYDLILTDLDMPNMDGLEMTQEIIERLGEDAPPIVAFTAHVVAGFKERCLAAGMVDYVAKPAGPAQLLDVVRKHVRPSANLLAVDDSEESLELVRRFLAGGAWSIQTVSNGREAIERIRGGGIDAVLLDMNMPELDGYETARRIRSLPEEGGLPILAMTSWVGPEEEARCLEAGCSAYIEKPLRRGALTRAVHSLLDSAEPKEEEGSGGVGPVVVDPTIADLIPEYLEDRRAEVATLRGHLARGDLESIRVLAHNLAGSGEPYGFPKLTELGRALEAVALDGGREQVGVWLDELEGYLGSVEWTAGDE